jgi:hypothetical protein
VIKIVRQHEDEEDHSDTALPHIKLKARFGSDGLTTDADVSEALCEVKIYIWFTALSHVLWLFLGSTICLTLHFEGKHLTKALIGRQRQR